MDSIDLREAFDRLKFGEDAFHELMGWRIRQVLLVLPHYDAWILEHDTKLSDQIVGEYHQLNLTTVPRLTTVADGNKALQILDEKEFDLIIVGMRVGDMTPGELALRVKARHPNLGIVLLLSSRSDLAAVEECPLKGIDARFLWTGDSRLFLAMIKYIEDLRNAPNDAQGGRVGVLLLVEDSVSFYSSYLPLLYSEVMTQTQRLIVEEMNDNDKYWRMRTRPKILLARDWEEAVELGERYREALIGIILDISFQKKGVMTEHAGFRLMERFRSEGVTVPILFQSSDDTMSVEARKRSARFQGKLTGNLHRGIRRFLLEELGFGDFVFRNPEGVEIHRVRTLREFEVALDSLPAESILYHAERNDYSRWMAAHGEYQVARRIKPVQTSDFKDPEDQRKFLAQSFREVREARYRGRVVEFRLDDPGAPGSVARFGNGSLGGKGRGLAFFNALFNASPWGDRYAPLRVEIPRSLIIATGELDAYQEATGLPKAEYADDMELRQSFLDAELSDELMKVLEAFTAFQDGPLAVRSSALLEDSQSIPFAGVYDTYMLPAASSHEIRFNRLSQALRLVWASTFSQEATAYRNALGIGQEEEKMAVVIQTMAGSHYEGYWFPRLSGTAQSLNYYPVGPMARDDGAACIAVGLGRSVVGGHRGFFFCPHHPKVPWSTEEDRWREGQTHFWALKDDDGENIDLSAGETATLTRLTMREGEDMGILRHMASTWDPLSHRLVDGIDSPGARVMDFRDILAYDWLPLAPLLDELLRVSRSAMGIPVELEYALDWTGLSSENAVFTLLQARPLISQLGVGASIPERPPDHELLLRSDRSLGQGIIRGVRDILWVDPDLYNPGETEELGNEVANIMDRLAKEKRSAVLVGPGRWGSRDRFLGIPVTWAQVRQAKLIVEVSRTLSDPEPSQGSHFFHNLVALGVGYSHVSPGSGFVNWNMLRQVSSGSGPVRLACFNEGQTIVLDGKNGLSWVSK